MRKQLIIVMILVLMATLLVSSVCFPEIMENYVTKSFDSTSGSLVLKTQAGTETTVSIPQTVKGYIKTKNNEDIEVVDVWNFLKDNLFKGTKVTIEKKGGVVMAIWVLEVPS
jgi:hypothetical protein